MAEEALTHSKFHVPTGQLLYRGLFFETQGADKTTVVYTLKDRDHEGFPSLYRLYMEMDDPTEYDFAVTYLAGWDHWVKLCKCSWFKPYVKKWREELEVRTKARALRSIKDYAKSSGKEAYQANKFLVSNGWIEKKTHGRGRPSKDDIKSEAERIARERTDLDEDFARITGTVQ